MAVAIGCTMLGLLPAVWLNRYLLTYTLLPSLGAVLLATLLASRRAGIGTTLLSAAALLLLPIPRTPTPALVGDLALGDAVRLLLFIALGIGLALLLDRLQRATRRERAVREVLARRERQQAALAELSQLALGTPPVEVLMNRAVAIAADVLGTEYAHVLELEARGERLRMRAGVGWRDDIVDRMTVGVGRGSHGGYTLATDAPVVVEDFTVERRFRVAEFVATEGMRSGVSVAIRGTSGPYGVLGAMTRTLRRFARDEVQLLQSIANVLAVGLQRRVAEEALGASEVQVRLAVAAAKIGYFRWHIETDAFQLDSRCAELLGGTPEDFPTGEAVFARLHPDDAPAVREDVRVATERPVPYRSEFRVIHPDGTTRWVAGLGTVLRDAQGRAVELTGVNLDISDRKEAEAALQASEERLWAILAHVGQGIVVRSRAGRIVMANEAFARMLGHSPEELTGLDERDLLPPEDLARVAAEHEAAYFTREPRSFEHRMRHRDGELRLVRATESVVPDAAGAPVLVAAVEDITEQRLAEEALRHTQKLESLGVLSAGIAHDFNNILTGIQGNASFALQVLPRGGTEDARTLLREILHASERAADLTRQLLAYAGKARTEVGPVDLCAFTGELANLLRASVSRLIAIEVDGEAHCPPVEADRNQIQQILMNLIINAAEAMEDAPGVVRVTLAHDRVSPEDAATRFRQFAVEPGEFVRVAVSDSGHGIPPELRERIFDPFFTTKFLGRGLGLSAVLGIVRSHRGAIEVDSTPGRGTTFRVWLPASRHPETASPPPLEVPSPVATSGVGTVLVVDDEEHIRRIATRALEAVGYRVLTAGDGAEAVDVFRRHRDEVDAVVLDLTMPVMGGEDAAAHLRRLKPEVPILVTSGYDDREIMGWMNGLDIRAFLQKPYTAERLVARVGAMVPARR